MLHTYVWFVLRTIQCTTECYQIIVGIPQVFWIHTKIYTHTLGKKCKQSGMWMVIGVIIYVYIRHISTSSVASLHWLVGHNLGLPILLDSTGQWNHVFTLTIQLNKLHCWTTLVKDFLHSVSIYSYYSLLKWHKVHFNLCILNTIDACTCIKLLAAVPVAIVNWAIYVCTISHLHLCI